MSCDEPPTKKLKTGDTRPHCIYGEKCYRKNPQHFKDFTHPQKQVATPNSSSDSTLPPCKYGVNCYRKNLLHFAEYLHPSKGIAENKTEEKADDSGGDTDTDIQYLLDDNIIQSKLVTSKTEFLKRGVSLIKSFSKMTEDERKELIQKAFEAKQHLQEKLKESHDKIEQQSKELARLQEQVNTGSLLMEEEENVLKGTVMRTYNLVAERAYIEGSAAQVHFRLAESQFYRLISGQSTGYRVTKVEYIVNPELVKRFKQAREEMKNFREEEAMSYPVLAFHGTQAKNIEPICKTGFREPGESGFKHRTDTGWYGKGVYFSEYPTYSMGYIQGATKLLLCQVLLGKIFQCTTLIHGEALTSGHDSHTSPDKKELVIFNSHHILPCYVVHYENTSREFKYTDNKNVAQKPKLTKAQMADTYQKARKVKKSKVFAGQGFTLLGKLSDTQTNLENLLVKHCGYSASKLSPGGLLNPIVTSPAALKTMSNATTLIKGRNTNVPILREDYIYDCILQQRVLDREPYLLE